MVAGAVGSRSGARPAGQAVPLCGRVDYLRAMRAKGLAVKSIRGVVSVAVNPTERPRDFAPYGLTRSCVKAYDTDQATGAMRGCFAEGGAILPCRVAWGTKRA
jgi:ketopantoate reductase